MKIAATVGSCQDVGTEASVQTLLHKRTAHRCAGEVYVHIAVQNSGGNPSEPAAFRRFRDFILIQLFRPRIWKYWTTC